MTYPNNKNDIEASIKATITGRIIRALPFLIIIFVLGVWSTGFFLLESRDFIDPPDEFRCLAFFGGLLVSVTIGGLGGILVRRLLWKVILARIKQSPSKPLSIR